MDDEALKKIIAQSEPFISSSLDAVCVINSDAEVIYANSLMKSLLSLKPRDLAKKPVFCDLIKLSICKDKCQVKVVLQKKTEQRFDEVPGILKGSKMRVNIKITPFSGPNYEGAVICMRDTTAELLTQAKYTKLAAIVRTQEDQIEYHKDLLRKIRSTR